MKECLKQVVSVAISVLLAVSAIPQTAFAADVQNTGGADGAVHVYVETPGDTQSSKYMLTVNETAVPVIKYAANGNHVDVARFACESAAPDIQVSVQEEIRTAAVFPQRYYPETALTVSEDKHTLTFPMAEELRYAIVMINGGPADQAGKPYLALVNDPPETDKPNSSNPNVLNFKTFSEEYLREHPNASAEEPVPAGTTSGGVAYGEGELVDNNTAQVRFPNKRKMTADDVTLALQAALDEIYKEGSPYDTLYFPSGTYTWSGLEIRNRKGKQVNIYLEEGALLKNRIQECMQAMEPAVGIWDSEDITISGRGIIDGNGVANYLKDRHDAKDSCHQGGVMIVRSKNITFNDTYLRDAKQWNWESHGSKHCTLNNVKGLSPYPQPWVDGLNMASAQNLTINGALTLGNDDCFASGHYNPSDGFPNTVPGFDEYNADALAWDVEDTFGVSVSNTLGWTFGPGNGIRIGFAEKYGHERKDYTFDNVNAVNFQGGGCGLTIRNNMPKGSTVPSFERITVKNSSFDTTRVGTNAFFLGKEEQKIGEVVMENCYFNAASGAVGKLFDFQNIDKLTIKDLCVGGQKVSYTSDLSLNTMNIGLLTFVNGDTAVEENHLPVITSPSGTINAYAGNPLVLQVKAEDADEGDTITYTAELGELESRARFDSAAKKFSWTPVEDDIGKTYSVTFIVMDHTEKPVKATVQIKVNSSQNGMTGYPVSEDAHVQSWGSEKEINYGSNPYLDVNREANKGEMGENNPGDGKLTFLKFDLAQLREQKDLFDRAELSLTYIGMRKAENAGKEAALKVAELADDSWIEGNGIRDDKNHVNNIDGAITWNNKPQLNISADMIHTSAGYSLGANQKDKPLAANDKIDGTRVTVDITDIVQKALEDETKENLSLIVNESNGYEHYFVSREGAAFYNNATEDMAPSIYLNIPIAIDIEGPAEMTLTEGYAAAETDSFALKGASGPYQVTLSGDTGSGKITWDSETQQIKIAEGLTKGVYEVTVTSVSTTDASVSKSMKFTLTVKGIPTVTAVAVTPKTASVKQGAEQTFTATVTGENNPSTEVIWSVSGGTSEVTKITAEGKLTVGSDETAQTLTVTATSKADAAKSDTATVTVTTGGTQPTEPTVTAVAVTPKTASVKQGAEQTFTATVTGENNPSAEVIWSVSGGTSDATKITAEGELTVGSDETAQTLTVTATSKADAAKSDTATVTVTTGGTQPTEPTVTAVAVTPKTASVKQGAEQIFTATVTGENNPSAEVIWSVSGGASAATKITAEGKLTVGSDETAQTLTVTATSKADAAKSDTATVTVTKGGTQPTEPTVTAVAVTPKTASVKQGAEQTFTATVTGENNPSKEVIWSVSGGASEATKITAEGKLTVGSDETAQTLTVTATSKADAAKSDTATVTVTKGGTQPTEPTVTAVAVTPKTVSVKQGAEQTFTATVTGENNPSTEVIWSVSGGSSAATKITAEGKLMVGSDETAQTLTVTATSKADSAKSGTATVTVVKNGGDTVIPVKRIRLNKTKVTLGVKEKFVIEATILPENATASKTKPHFESSKPNVAAVNQKGQVTAKKAGKATITVSAGGKKAKCTITVKAAPKRISLNAKSKKLKKGQTFQIKVKLPKNTASYKITYKSSKKSVASVDAKGKVKARKKGTATITVTSFNKKKAKVKIIVR